MSQCDYESCRACTCGRCARCEPSDRPGDVDRDLDEAAHAIADACGQKVYYTRRGTLGGSRVYVGGGGAIHIPTGFDYGAMGSGCYTRSIKVDKPDHIRPYVMVSMELHFLPVETAEALLRWLFNREE